MPNTTLPTDVTSGSTGHAGFHNTVHTEINRLTRDTGLRDISGYLINGWTLDSGGYALIRRVDERVTLYLKGLNGSAATTQTFLAAGNTAAEGISTNFTPSPNGVSLQTMSPLYRPAVGSPPWYLFYSNNSWRTANVDSAAAIVSWSGSSGIEWSWTANRAWPSFLPPEVA